MGKAGSRKSSITDNPSEEEAAKVITRWKRFRSFVGLTQEDIPFADRQLILLFENSKFDRINWLEWKKKLEKFMKDVTEQLKLEEGEEASEIKTRARQLLEEKMMLFNKIKAIKDEIRLDDEKIAKLECEVGVNVTDPSTSEAVPQIKEEPSSQPPEDARLQVHQKAVKKLANYEWLKKHLKDRCRQRHFVYIVIHPVTKKIIYIGESNDVMIRIQVHRKNPNSAIYEILKEFPTIEARIIFTGSYYACKAVESMIINLRGELRLDLKNIRKESEAVTPKNKNYVQIEADIQTIISDFPIKLEDQNHDRLLNAIKLMLDRSIENGEIITNMTEELWNRISGAQLHFDKREARGIDETGLTIDKPFEDLEDEPQNSDMAKFIDEFTEFRTYYGLTYKAIVGHSLSLFMNMKSPMKLKTRQKWKAKLEKFMEEYQREHGAMVIPGYLEMIIPRVEKRIEQYQKYLDWLKLKRCNQPRIIAELEFQKDIYTQIYSTEVEASKPEILSQQSQSRADYIWIRKLLKDRDGKLHYVYGVRDPVTGKFVYWGETEDTEERIQIHRSDPDSSIYEFLQENVKVEVLQISSGPYFSCKTIETILIALENEFDCMDLLNKRKNARKTTPKKKKYVCVGEGVFCLPEEFDLNKDETRAKLIDAMECLLEEAQKDNIFITSVQRQPSTRKRSHEESSEEVMSQEGVKRRLFDPSVPAPSESIFDED